MACERTKTMGINGKVRFYSYPNIAWDGTCLYLIWYLPLGPGRAAILPTNRAETAIKSFITIADNDGLGKARIALVLNGLAELEIDV